MASTGRIGLQRRLPCTNTVTLTSGSLAGCGHVCTVHHATSSLIIDLVSAAACCVFEGSLHRIAGSLGALQLEEEGIAAWSAACFPSLTAAEACATSLQSAQFPSVNSSCYLATVASKAARCRTDLHAPHLDRNPTAVLSSAGRFGHLGVCLEPDWRAFGGRSKASARADLHQLAERTVWRNRKLELSPHWAVCLARGADAVLAAVHLAGGVQAFRLANGAAAYCLGHGLIQAVGDLRRRWLPTGVRERAERAFVLLGPEFLQLTAGDLQEGVPICSQRAYVAVRLAHVFVTRSTRPRVGGAVPTSAVAESIAKHSQVRRQVFAFSKSRFGCSMLPACFFRCANALALSRCKPACAVSTQVPAAGQCLHRKRSSHSFQPYVSMLAGHCSAEP